MSRIPISAEASLLIVVVLLFMVAPAGFAGALIAVIMYPDSWPLQLVGCALPSACIYLLLLYLILSIDDRDGPDILLPMSIIPLGYSLLTAIFLPIFAEPSNHVLIAAAIVSPIIGLAFLLVLFFRIEFLRHTHRRRLSPTNSAYWE